MGRAIAVLLAVMTLAACSGGGGGGGGGGGKTQASSTTTYTAAGANIIAKVISYYTDGTQSVTTGSVVTKGPTTVAADHVTASGNFSFGCCG